MYRWHKELPLLKARLRERDRIWGSKIRESLGCDLGKFRKVHPLRCPNSRNRGTGGCKMHKNLGNGKKAKTFQYIKELMRAEVDWLPSTVQDE